MRMKKKKTLEPVNVSGDVGMFYFAEKAGSHEIDGISFDSKKLTYWNDDGTCVLWESCVYHHCVL